MFKVRKYATDLLGKSIDFVWRDAIFYVVISGYTLFAVIFLYAINATDMLSHSLYFKQWASMFLFLMPVIALCLETIYVIHRFDKRRQLAFRRMFSTERMAMFLSGMALLMGLMFFQGSFTSVKNALPLLQGGFPHDQFQADIDAWLHFGIDPWQLVHGFGATDTVRTILEWNYNVVWFIICFGALFFVATSPRARHVRTRYMVMFMLVWVVCGNLLAGLFLSAGPVFYNEVTGDTERFGQLVEFLAGSGNDFSSATAFQSYLWRLYETRQAGFGSGISAFPSVHVALITMNALFLNDVSKRLGYGAFAYAGVIVASSVYLGWHYAIDGYVSIVVVAAMHYICKRLMSARRGISTIDLNAKATTAIPLKAS